VTRFGAAAVLLALVVSGSALAAVATHGEAKKRIRPADQARAKAMLLKRSDLPAGFRASKPEPDSGHYYCKALDESDLTLTGEAEQPGFESQPFYLTSVSQLYLSVGQANTSWRRGTSAAGLACARRLYTEELKKEGVVVRSVRPVAFPKVGQRSFALRLEARSQAVPVFLDLVAMQHSRAHVTLMFVTPLAPFPRAEQVRLARLTAGRMAKAMRGA
jgi:hypothetical protein